MVCLEYASLPSRRITLAAVSIGAPYIENTETVIIGRNPDICSPISSHPDVNLCYVGGKTVFVAAGMSAICYTLQSHGFEVIYTEKRLSSDYPGDSLLNAAVFGKTAVLNPKTVSAVLLEYLKEQRFRIIAVNQGYAKCSVYPIDENSIITSDRSIAEKCESAGIDSLYVTPHGIDIDGYKYGFIGGCGGMCDLHTALFFGDIDRHTDGKKIRAFLTARGVDIVKTDGALTDHGSFIPLMQSK